MLAELFIDNFVIIKRNHIFFEDGFNVLTGETGSGKSLILEAINLLLGKKANLDTVGRFAEKTLIEGVFVLNPASLAIVSAAGISFDEDDNKLIISRTISEKSSTLRINGRVSNLSTLRDFAPALIDIYNQGDSFLFMTKASYINLIDSYSADRESQDLRNELKELISQKNEYIKKSASLNLTDEEIVREREMLSFQIKEIEDIDLFSINEEELDSEYKKLNNINELREAIFSIKNILDNSDYGSSSISAMVSHGVSEISNLTDVDPKVNEFYDRLVEIGDLTNDLYSDLDMYEDSLTGDPERAAEIEDLMASLFNLKRKYGGSVTEIIDYYDTISARIKELDEIENLKSNLDKIISDIDKKLERAATRLHDIRLKKSKVLEEKINASISDLNIKNGKLRVDFRKKDLDSTGFDDIDFLIRTNKGEALKPLSSTASGGEKSRLMLAFKEIFADFEASETMIFDEIDTGISGRTAQIVGEKILDLSKDRQVISISHLPQIASLADNHILISKEDTKDFTISSTKKVTGDERINEIARLIGGVNITEITTTSASEMLAMAEELKNDRR